MGTFPDIVPRKRDGIHCKSERYPFESARKRCFSSENMRHDFKIYDRHLSFGP